MYITVSASATLLALATSISARTIVDRFPKPFSTTDQKPISPPRSSGLNIPSIGLGLWNSKDKSATHAVEAAFSAGYTHLDSAAAYSNEAYVGAGLDSATTNRSRSSYWLTSKLWNDAHAPSKVEPALRQTLHDLNTTHLDLYLMHWPVAFVPNKSGRTIIDQDTSLLSTWRAMEALVTANLTRHIGISNFSPRQIDVILKDCAIAPYAHEFETHPYLQQQEFVDWHLSHGIKVIAYSPLANLNPTYNGTHPDLKPILEDEFWVELARNKSLDSVAQAVLGWGIQRGTVVIPKSTHVERIRENFGAREVRFTEEEMLRVRERDRRARFNDPSKGWGVELFEGLDGGSNRFIAKGGEGGGEVEEL
jgi:alcohol dehydrogenase (NADP+)